MSMITKDSWKDLCLLKQETDINFLLLGDKKQCPLVECFDEKLYNVLEDVGSVNVGDVPLLSFHGLLT
jgi:hypothetical protein